MLAYIPAPWILWEWKKMVPEWASYHFSVLSSLSFKSDQHQKLLCRDNVLAALPHINLYGMGSFVTQTLNGWNKAKYQKSKNHSLYVYICIYIYICKLIYIFILYLTWSSKYTQMNTNIFGIANERTCRHSGSQLAQLSFFNRQIGTSWYIHGVCVCIKTCVFFICL